MFRWHAVVFLFVYAMWFLTPYSHVLTDEESQGADETTIGEMIRRQRSAPIEEFEIIHDKDSKIWQVQGVGLERFVQMTNWE